MYILLSKSLNYSFDLHSFDLFELYKCEKKGSSMALLFLHVSACELIYAETFLRLCSVTQSVSEEACHHLWLVTGWRQQAGHIDQVGLNVVNEGINQGPEDRFSSCLSVIINRCASMQGFFFLTCCQISINAKIKKIKKKNSSTSFFF